MGVGVVGGLAAGGFPWEAAWIYTLNHIPTDGAFGI